MKYKIRKWLYRSFILIFILLTSSISIYATGYQLNWRGQFRFNHLLVKTGTLAIDSLPTGANIYINEHLETNFSLQKFKNNNLSTPAKIKNLSPGEYNIRLEKDGYWPWEKKLNILAEQTTYAENINLFKKDSLLNIFECTCQEISLSPNRRYLLLKQGKKIIDLKNNQELVLNLNGAIDQEQWLNKSNWILINSLLINLDDNSIIDYQKIIGPEISQLYYDESNNRLYYEYKNSLNYFDPKNNTSQSLLNGEYYLSYVIKNNTLFYLTENNKKTILKSFDLNSHEITATELVYSPKYKFLNDSVQWLSIYDQKNQSLYLLDTVTLKPVRETIKNYRGGVWLQNDKLLYYTDFEIYLFDLKQNNKILINRIGEQITDLVWQAKNNYIIYATKTKLNTLDFATSNIVNLLNAENISSIFLDLKNNTLYFTAKISDKSGMYKMIVQ